MVIATSTVFIFLSYLIAVGVAFRAQRKGEWKNKGEFSLGKYSLLCNGLACGWLTFVVILFMLPPNYLTLYATAALLVGLVAIYATHGKYYQGMSGVRS